MARNDQAAAPSVPGGRARRILRSLGDRIAEQLEQAVDPEWDRERRGTFGVPASADPAGGGADAAPPPPAVTGRPGGDR